MMKLTCMCNVYSSMFFSLTFMTRCSNVRSHQHRSPWSPSSQTPPIDHHQKLRSGQKRENANDRLSKTKGGNVLELAPRRWEFLSGFHWLAFWLVLKRTVPPHKHLPFPDRVANSRRGWVYFLSSVDAITNVSSANLSCIPPKWDLKRSSEIWLIRFLSLSVSRSESDRSVNRHINFEKEQIAKSKLNLHNVPTSTQSIHSIASILIIH